MDGANFSEWLKTSVPGILLLGAVGSIIAVGALRVATTILVPLARASLAKFVAAMSAHFVTPMAKQMARVTLQKHGENRFATFYALQVVKVVFWLFVSTSALLIFLYVLALPADTFVRRTVLAPLVVFFVAGWWALRTVMGIYLSSYTDIDALIEKAAKEFVQTKPIARTQAPTSTAKRDG